MTKSNSTISTVCFTGHRPKSIPWIDDLTDERYIAVKDILKQKIIDAIDNGITHFISGMAEGVDLLVAELVLEAKWDYPFIFLECAIPFSGQDTRFSKTNQQRYQKIIENADKVSVLSNRYYNGCLFSRNLYMVENSSLLIAVFNGIKEGGTFQTISLAKKKNLEVWVVNC